MDGYNSNIENIRKQEFPGLSDITYLDHAGATLYAKSQLASVQQDLMSHVYGNPHSPCASSKLSTDTIEQVRYRILQHFNTSPEFHSVIFTAGCTAALKLLADNFDWACHNHLSQLEETTPKSSSSQSPENPEVQSCLKQLGNVSQLSYTSVLPENLNQYSYQVISNSSQDKVQLMCSQHAMQKHLSQNTMRKAGLFCYLLDNHTSVVGMREIAKSKGVDVFCITYQDIKGNTDILIRMSGKCFQELCSSCNHPENCFVVKEGPRNCLFAYPAQSNFSGVKYPLELASEVISSSDLSPLDHWAVVLDAASLVSTSPLDLSECEADFIAISFYKMFGFPTGLGALIVRNDSAHFLHKSYFGGGTVQAYLAQHQFSVPKSSLTDHYEDGTLPFLDIIALKHGFDTLERLAGNMCSISDHTFTLAKYVHHKMSSYRHANGQPVANLFCDNDFENKEQQGPVVNFLLLRSTGEFIGYTQIEKLASLHGIHLRTGCFCNTGACQRHLDLTDEQVLSNFQTGHVCGDEVDIISGQPTGSVRISFGYMSTLADANKFLSFVEECFMEKSNQTDSTKEVNSYAVKEQTSDQDVNSIKDQFPSSSQNDNPSQTHDVKSELDELRDNSQQSCITSPTSISLPSMVVKKIIPSGKKVLTNIFLYPVKSCGAFEVSEWQIGSKGLLYDRHWMVVNENGVCLSQKREERLCLIKPVVDLNNRCLWLQCQGLSPIRVPVDVRSEISSNPSSKIHCQSKVCFDRVQTLDCGDTVANWLSDALGKKCRLLQQNPEFERNCKLVKDAASVTRSHLSLVNESPFTLLCRSSAQSLRKAIGERYTNQPIINPSENRSDPFEPITAEFPLSTEKGKGLNLHTEELIGRFRGNLVIDGWEAFDEDEWKKIQIGSHLFTVAGACVRCQMVCVDQNTAKRSTEPLLTLSFFRGKKVPFGIHLLQDEASFEGTTLRVGDDVSVIQGQ
ncbi:molybdenum cofactor sulfurase-like isoform X2 [Acanthaster planci]|nr:molybdenum cofactor sulfurase-like isoform X2 [Acanthaster planci]